MLSELLCVFIYDNLLNWLDLIIVLLITIPTFFGFRKGFLRKVLGIAGIIIGFILAVRFYDPIAGFLHGIISGNELFIQVISFLLIIDKIAGTIFGFLQGLIIASVLLVNLSYIGLPGSETRNNSVLYSRVYKVAPIIFDKIISYSPSLAQIYREYKQKYLPEK
jgi:uncharacterized membrane protein required for colicin V production